MHDLVLLTLLLVYALWEYVLAMLVTRALKAVFAPNCLDLPSFEWSFEWISFSPGVTECRVAFGTFRWANPAKFRVYPYFLELKRVELRFDARPTLRWLWAKVFASSPVTEKTTKRPTYLVSALEVEGVTVNLERKNGKLNLWAALGLSEDECRAEMEAHSVAEGDADEKDDDFEEVDADDDDDAVLVPEKEEEHSEGHDDSPLRKHWSKFLGEFAVDRATIRNVKSRVEAFVRPNDTHVFDKNPVKIKCLDMTKRELRPKKLTKKKLANEKRQGLFLDELIWRLIWRVTKAVWRAPQITSLAGKIAKDQSKAAVKSTGKTIQNAILNVTHHVTHHSSTTGTSSNTKGAPQPVATATTAAASRDVAGGPFVVRVRVHDAKHLGTASLRKPSTYVKLAAGKNGPKAKSPVAGGTRNPTFDYGVDLAPVASLDDDLRVQMFHRPLLSSRETRLFPTLKLPLCDLLQADVRATWFAFPDKDDDDANKHDDLPQSDHLGQDDDDDDDDEGRASTSTSTSPSSKLPSIRLSVALLSHGH